MTSLLTNFVAAGYDGTHGLAPAPPAPSAQMAVDTIADRSAMFGLQPVDMTNAMMAGTIALQNQAVAALGGATPTPAAQQQALAAAAATVGGPALVGAVTTRDPAVLHPGTPGNPTAGAAAGGPAASVTDVVFPGLDIASRRPELRLVGGVTTDFPELTAAAQGVTAGGPGAYAALNTPSASFGIVPNAAVDVFSAIGLGGGPTTTIGGALAAGSVLGGGLAVAAVPGASAAVVATNTPTEFTGLGQPASTPVLLQPTTLAAGTSTVPDTRAVINADGSVSYVTTPAASTAPAAAAPTSSTVPAAGAVTTPTAGASAGSTTAGGASTKTTTATAAQKTAAQKAATAKAATQKATAAKAAAAKVVPKKTTTTSAAAKSAATSAKTRSITVKSGDTLSKLAATYHTTVARLAALNGIKDVNKVAAGRTLTVPA